MAKNDFIPGRDGDLNGYETNFLTKLDLHSATLGMDPVEIAKVTTAVNAHRVSYAAVLSKRAESKSANEDNVLKKRLAVKELRRAAQLVKSLSNYTKAIGDDLQIIGSEKNPVLNEGMKPVLKTKVDGQEVMIRYKKEVNDGLKIYTRRGTETEFSFLVLTTKSPYVDKRPKLESSKPEQREYYAVFFQDIRDVGKQSDVIKVTIA